MSVGFFGSFLSVLLLVVATAASAFSADIDVLIVGSTGDSTASGHVSGNSSAFDPTSVRTYLQNILQGADVGTVNVQVENRGFPYDLAAWFHYPLPAGVETSNRWPNLRGEAGTDWDYVIVIGDPYTMEYMPGLYAQGVAMVAREAAKGGAETVLLMPWPGNSSTSTVAHYKEVVYRAGRSGPYKVAPAGLAWEAAGSPRGTTHPTADGAFIAAASIYSTIWNQSASASTYVYNDTMANAVHTSVTTNNSAIQYTGAFSFQNPFLMLGDKRRDVHFSERGTSTEEDYKKSVIAAMDRAGVTYDVASYDGNYKSNTPPADAKSWPTGNSMPIAWNHGRKFAEPDKEYKANPAYWQLGMGFSYQTPTWGQSVATANDMHIAEIMSDDIKLASYMRAANNIGQGQHSSARCIPWRLIWAQIHQAYPELNPLEDGGAHQNEVGHRGVGTYMYTLYSGRCPLSVQPNPITATWLAEKIGYETAWRLGRCQTRAPGFKVLPSAATKTTIMSGTTETMTVQFILPPLANVTVNVTSSNPSVATVSPSQLTFTPANHSMAQAITVTALNGLSADANIDLVFTTVSTDEVYNNLNDSWRYAVQSKPRTVEWTSASQISTSERGTLTLTAQLSAAASQPVTVPITLSGSATKIQDFSYSATQITIPPGATTGSTTITITNDTKYEHNDTVVLTMRTPTNATLGAKTVHTVTITDDDAPPTVQWASDGEASLGERGTFTVTAKLSVYSDVDAFVPFTVSGTATRDSDYTISGNPIRIKAGSLTGTATISIKADLVNEGPETVILTMGTPTNATLGARTVYTATINPTTVQWWWNGNNATSSGESGTFTATAILSEAANQTVTVPFTISGTATNGSDYTITASQITINPGADRGEATITILPDLVFDEGLETVILTMGTPTGAALGASTVFKVTIDPRPIVDFTTTGQFTTGESGTYTVTAQLSAPTNQIVTVPLLGDVYAHPYNATRGSDFTIMANEITIKAGETTGSVMVTIIDDSLDENDEHAYIEMGTPTNAKKGGNYYHSITIKDDDASPTVAWTSASQTSVTETGIMKVTAQLSEVSGREVYVYFSVTGTSEADDRTITVDSGSTRGVFFLHILPGTTGATATITIAEDSLIEGDETVILTMGTPTNATLGATKVHTATITDDDIANRAPTLLSEPSALPNPATTDDTVAFNSSASDLDSDPLVYTWDFGDGASTVGATASHRYSVPGVYSATVTVSDGRGGSVTGSVTVTVVTPAIPVNLRVNFQLAGTSVPSGYLSDTGAVFGARGNGQSYGWNADNSSTARDRNAANSPDQRYDTLQHLQKPQNPNAVWEIAVPNGTYSVRVVAGDSSHFDSIYKLNVEGVLTVSSKPTATARWFEGTKSVTVSDGRLTVGSAAGAANNKICFIEIENGVAARELASEAPEALPLNVTKLQLAMNFAKPGRDGYRVIGTLPGLSAEFSLAGQTVSVDVGAAIAEFTLDAKGHGKNKNGTFTLKRDEKSGWMFAASIKKGAWTEAWSDGGLLDTTTTQDAEIPVMLTLAGQTFGGSKMLTYKAKEKTSATAK